MTASTTVFAASGDVGGLRALVPVLRRFMALGGEVVVWAHRDLPRELPEARAWSADPGTAPLPPAARMVFSTSVADRAPLSLARRCRSIGMPVDCVLDNWMNYRLRLELDGKGLFVPDRYFVMDELARDQALQDGLPPSCLVVSGHPGLQNLERPDAAKTRGHREWIRRALNIPEGCRLLAFVSEPVEKDQGSDPSSSQYRGYTEKTVLKLLCDRLRCAPGRWALCVLPHPREDAAEVRATWRAQAGDLPGGVLPAGGPSSRDAVAAADGVAGMASILLYVSWVLGRPTLSLQPGVRLADLRVYRARPGVRCVEDAEDMVTFAAWLADAEGPGWAARRELSAHQGAADFIARGWLELPRPETD